MPNRCFLIVTGVGFLISGCIGSVYNKTLNDGYYLSAMGTRDDMTLCYQDGKYGTGVIMPTVFAVGQNSDYIIAKQYPKKFPDKINKITTNYFIVPLKRKISTSVTKNFIGPLTLAEFESQKHKLNIDAIKFDIIFKDLE